MIQLLAAGKCDGCAYVEPIVSTLYCDGRPFKCDVHCKHENLCDQIENYLIEVFKKDIQGDD